jgi:hypothetical protein
MSLEKVIKKHIEMQVALDKAMTWKPKGFTKATRILILFLTYVLTFIWFGIDMDDSFGYVLLDIIIWVVAYKILGTILLCIHLALLSNVPRVPIDLMEELGVPTKIIGKCIRNWYWKHS